MGDVREARADMPPTVLVVDDEPDILEILRIALESAGYSVALAADGHQALHLVEESCPDAMLLDIGMPDMSGWEVLERIKSRRGGEAAEIPVVMLTAWTSEEDRLRGGIEGAVRYLGKPFDPAEVTRVIDELLAPGGPSEPELRREVQTRSLERLARMEGGEPEYPGSPRVHLTRLDRPRAAEAEPPGLTAETLAGFLAGLPPKQREVAARLSQGATVSDVAAELGVSRSNVYAMVRRVARRADLPDGRALIHRLRRLSPRRRGPAPSG